MAGRFDFVGLGLGLDSAEAEGDADGEALDAGADTGTDGDGGDGDGGAEGGIDGLAVPEAVGVGTAGADGPFPTVAWVQPASRPAHSSAEVTRRGRLTPSG